ncbi:MAG TPA: A/G-specific adenine glycosylase [Burkholderiaceae bacterium]|nr:A/G-specific adenine glycosylase [Burkholderiaceae bacterium]
MPRPTLAARVVAWQRRHGRHDLPWQNTRDAYRLWLSEVMLQQTQVATVLDYYPRFLARFPDVRALAAAPLDDVLALWSGLGYYRRARHLHHCAQVVVAEHRGRFPTDAATLATLPGVGRSTAAAIAVFAAGERAAILDGNVKRVLTRALGFGADLALAANERELWARAEALLPQSGIESYTQGLMDLGATLCRARAPRCDECPLGGDCVARAAGRPEVYPVKTRNLKRGARRNALLWLAHGDRVWLTQRAPRGVWAGLWTLPLFDDLPAIHALTADWRGAAEALPAFTHALTHFDWRLEPVRHVLPARASLRKVEQALADAQIEGRWFTRDQALALGLPAPIRKLIASQTA